MWIPREARSVAIIHSGREVCTPSCECRDDDEATSRAHRERDRRGGQGTYANLLRPDAIAGAPSRWLWTTHRDGQSLDTGKSGPLSFCRPSWHLLFHQRGSTAKQRVATGLTEAATLVGVEWHYAAPHNRPPGKLKPSEYVVAQPTSLRWRFGPERDSGKTSLVLFFIEISPPAASRSLALPRLRMGCG